MVRARNSTFWIARSDQYHKITQKLLRNLLKHFFSKFHFQSKVLSKTTFLSFFTYLSTCFFLLLSFIHSPVLQYLLLSTFLYPYFLSSFFPFFLDLFLSSMYFSLSFNFSFTSFLLSLYFHVCLIFFFLSLPLSLSFSFSLPFSLFLFPSLFVSIFLFSFESGGLSVVRKSVKKVIFLDAQKSTTSKIVVAPNGGRRQFQSFQFFIEREDRER